jgi:hypothetical protein
MSEAAGRRLPARGLTKVNLSTVAGATRDRQRMIIEVTEPGASPPAPRAAVLQPC